MKLLVAVGIVFLILLIVWVGVNMFSNKTIPPTPSTLKEKYDLTHKQLAIISNKAKEIKEKAVAKDGAEYLRNIGNIAATSYQRLVEYLRHSHSFLGDVLLLEINVYHGNTVAPIGAFGKIDDEITSLNIPTELNTGKLRTISRLLIDMWNEIVPKTNKLNGVVEDPSIRVNTIVNLCVKLYTLCDDINEKDGAELPPITKKEAFTADSQPCRNRNDPVDVMQMATNPLDLITMIASGQIPKDTVPQSMSQIAAYNIDGVTMGSHRDYAKDARRFVTQGNNSSGYQDQEGITAENAATFHGIAYLLRQKTVPVVRGIMANISDQNWEDYNSGASKILN